MTRQRIIWILVACLIVGLAYLFYQYKQVAMQAEQQVEKDIRLIEQGFRDGSSHWLQTEQHSGKRILKTQLVMQTIDEKNRFIRQYHSELVKEGERSCLQTRVIYPNKQAEILTQTFVQTQMCLP